MIVLMLVEPLFFYTITINIMCLTIYSNIYLSTYHFLYLTTYSCLAGLVGESRMYHLALSMWRLELIGSNIPI